MPSKVLVREQEQQPAAKSVTPWTVDRLLGTLGWLGVVLLAASLADVALTFFPTHFNSMEWEFGTISQIFAGLPLLLIALVAIWFSVASSGRRWQVVTVAAVLWLSAVVTVVMLVAFALDVPVALKTNAGPAHEQVMKLTLKTLFMGLLFAASFVYTGVLALRQVRETPAGEVSK